MFDFDVLDLGRMAEREEEERRRLALNPIRLDAPVTEVPRGPALTVPPEATLAAAIEAMRVRRRGSAVVVRGQRPVGLLTDREIVAQACGEVDELSAVPVEAIMSPCPEPLLETDNVATALRTMCAQRLWHLPIVCRRGLLVGALDLADLSLWLRDRLTVLTVEAALAV